MPDVTSAASIADALAPFRRRLRLIAFARVTPSAVLAGLAVAAVGAVASGAAAPLAVSLAVIATIAGIAVAWSIAFVRTPSLDGTARILDSRFALGNRAVTAWQFSAQEDAVSRLIVADARRHLARLSPASMALPRPSAAACAAAAMLALAPALIVPWSKGDSAGLARAQVRTQSRGAGASSSGSPAASPAVAGSPAAGVVSPVKAATTQAAASADRDSEVRRSANVNGATGRAGTPALEASADPETRSNTATAASGSAARTDGAATATALSAPPAQATTAAGSTATGAAGRNDVSAGAARNASGAGAAGLGAARTAGAGGVGSGSITAKTGVAEPTDSTPIQLAAADYRRARQAAESAIARDRVPPRLRSYVRDYFIAIGREAR